jgi:hypothetical protein
VRRKCPAHASELISRFEIAKINQRELSPEETKELQQAEELARRFLAWDIDENTQDVMDILKDMIDAVYGEEEEDNSETEEATQAPRIQDVDGQGHKANLAQDWQEERVWTLDERQDPPHHQVSEQDDQEGDGMEDESAPEVIKGKRSKRIQLPVN